MTGEPKRRVRLHWRWVVAAIVVALLAAIVGIPIWLGFLPGGGRSP